MPRTVFVSSTFVDLQTHRKAVWDTLTKFDVTVRGMEQFGARTETPLHTCLIEVEQSDVYVGIIAFRLGSIEASSGKSYTQLEYDRAIALSKDVLIYLADEENARVPVKFIDRDYSRDKLESFKSILRERHTVDTYTDEADLATKLKRDLQRHLTPKSALAAGADEFMASASKLEQFLLQPKSVAGTEVRLHVRTTSKPYPASREVCQAFNLEFGAAVGLPIQLIRPEEAATLELPNLYISAKQAGSVLPLAKGDELDGHMKMHFSGGGISEVRARFRSRTEYPRSQLGMSSVIDSMLGDPVHYPADSALALELSNLVRVTRASARAV